MASLAFSPLRSGRWTLPGTKSVAIGFEAGDWYSYSGGLGGSGVRSFSRTDDTSASDNRVQVQGRVVLRMTTLGVDWSAEIVDGLLTQQLSVTVERPGYLGDLALCARSADYPAWSRGEMRYRQARVGTKVPAENPTVELTGSEHVSSRRTGCVPADYVIDQADGSWRIHTRLRAGRDSAAIALRLPLLWGSTRLPSWGRRSLRSLPLYGQERSHPQIPIQLVGLATVEPGDHFMLRQELEVIDP